MSYHMIKECLRNQLLTKALKARFKKIGIQECEDPKIIAKFFDPCGSATWYISEYNEENNVAFGYVTGFEVNEWGNVSIDELEAIVSPPLGLPIERDRYFQEKPFSQLNLQ